MYKDVYIGLAHDESQQNLLLIEYQRIKYIKECNC